MGVYPKPILDSSKNAVVEIQKRVIGETKGGSIEQADLEMRMKEKF
jgi:hypothetical protein